MKAVLLCGLLALAFGATVKDKLSVKAGDTMGDGTSTSAYKLAAGTQLTSGQSLTSPDGKTTLTMQTGGNLVLSQGTTMLWSSGTSTTLVPLAKMETNGNFTVYGGTTVLWSSNTAGQTGAYLQLNDDANVVVYSFSNLMLWSWKYGLLANSASPNKLPSGGKLSPGMSLVCTYTYGYVLLIMQSDGNLVLYQNDNALWSSRTSGNSKAYALMQTNGNFSVYGGTTVLWSSNTAGSGAYLQVQNDTNVVVYSSGNLMLWSWKYGLLANPASLNKLPSGGKLSSGTNLVSTNGQIHLVMQSDGNLVLYQNASALWSSVSSDNSGAFAWMKIDGNLIVYLGTTALWSSGTAGQAGAYLQVQDDTNFVIYSSGNLMLWSWKYGLLANPASPNKLPSGGKLSFGMSLVSANGQIILTMQRNGNLVLFRNKNMLWSSRTSGNSGAYALMQTNGNFTVYGGTTVLWSSNTTGSGAYLQVQDDANVGVYSSGNLMLWSWEWGLLANFTSPSKLTSDGLLASGTFLTSLDGQTIVVMLDTGNLVVIQNGNTIWNSGTAGHPGAYGKMQSDGNFIIYQGSTNLWASKTVGQVGAYLQVQNDTNLVVYSTKNQTLWSWKLGLLVKIAPPSKLTSDGLLPSGTVLASPDGQTTVVMLYTGDLVVIHNGNTTWNSGTAGHPGAYGKMQSDGNFVIYQGSTSLWASNTIGTGAYLQVRDDTNLVLYSSGNQMLWTQQWGLVASTTAPNTLQSGAKLVSGTCLVSPNGLIGLTMQTDGSLVLYQNGIALWSSATAGKSGAYAQMQADGNFVVYQGTFLLWSSDTAGHDGAYLQLQDDSKSPIYNTEGLTLWSWNSGVLANPSEPNKLPSSWKLFSGRSLVSPNGQICLKMQSDGNLVLYQNITELWRINSSGKIGEFAWMQANGNFSLYAGTTVLWSTGTAGQAGAYLQVQDDTNCVVYNLAGQMLWSWIYGVLANPAASNKLPSGGIMLPSSFLISPNGQIKLAMQTDGNLVLYQDMTVIWSRGNFKASSVIMKTDGNLVIFQGTHFLFESFTTGLAGAYLQVQDDANLVIYSKGGVAVWSWQYAILYEYYTPSTLQSGKKLMSGRCLISPNRQTFLAMQTDGNLVLSQNGNLLWFSATSGNSGAYAVMQSNGNFTVYGGITALWSSNTAGSGAYLQVQNDTNLVVYSAGNQPLWSWEWGSLANPTSPSKLTYDGLLPSGTFLTSPDGQTTVVMLYTGDLVVTYNGNTTWNSGTAGHPGAYGKMHSDGNFAIYQGSTSLWASKTIGTGAYLQVRDDTNLVLYSSGNQVLWTLQWGLVASTTAPNTLQSGAKLVAGTCLVSPNGLIGLTMQVDGNLVLYQNGTALWSSATAGKSGAYAQMQADGNFVVYQGTSLLWSSDTAGLIGGYLQVQDDNNLLLYSLANQAFWSWKWGSLANAASPSKLISGEQLSGTFLNSPDRQTFVVMLNTGDLVVIYNRNMIFSTGTANNPGAYGKMQSDGNFVIYQGSTSLWASNTGGQVGAYLQVRDDSNLVVYSATNQMLWTLQWGVVRNSTASNKLPSGSLLLAGTCLVSPNGLIGLTLQRSGGNLVLYQNRTALWSNGPAIDGVYALGSMQSDGNFVIEWVYPMKIQAWSSGTAGQTGAYLEVRDDANVVIYNSTGAQVWSMQHGLV